MWFERNGGRGKKGGQDSLERRGGLFGWNIKAKEKGKRRK